MRPEWWLKTQMNVVINELEANGVITFDPIPEKSRARAFTITANPVLRLVSR